MTTRKQQSRRKFLLAEINKSALLQSLLYDIDLLPEQIKDDDARRWGYVESIVVHFKLAKLTIELKEELTA